MRRFYIFLIIHLLIQSFSLYSLGTAEKNIEKKPSDYKIVLILPGPINDQSWNATNFSGLLACNNELGTNIEYIENVQTDQFIMTFRNYAEKGYDLIMAAGTQFDETANNVAQYYPDTKFCVVNGMLSKSSNVTPIFPKEYEASFLAGIIASYITESGTLGSVGGYPNRAMVDLLDVYEKTAVKYAKENRNLDIHTVRDYSNSWENVSLGKRMAEEMIEKGADVLFFYANQVGLGAIQAANENQIKYIGFSSNQNKIAPDTVVASIGFDFETFYKWAITLFLEGKLEGKVNLAGVKQKIFVPYYTDSISESIREAVDLAIEQINNDKVDFESLLSKSF